MVSEFEEYWRRRAVESLTETYRGRGMAKMPEDLRTYERVIWETRPAAILELGTFEGGSALWFADRLRTLCDGGLVVTVDITARGYLHDPLVEHITGDLKSPEVVEEVHRKLAGRRVMVSEDSFHSYDSTLSALTLYSDLVAPGCYFVVEDGIVEQQPFCPPNWYAPGSVGRAIEDFLSVTPGWKREYLAPYTLTTDHGGWLKRG